MALITVEFYEVRYGAGDDDQIEAFIDDVSAEVLDYLESIGCTAGEDWGVDSSETEPPESVQAAVARIVNRAVGNPYGISQEGLGDHQRTFTVGAAGGMMSPKDRRIIRRAAGCVGFKMLEQDSWIPVPDEDT